MCAGAMSLARVARLVYAAADPRAAPSSTDRVSSPKPRAIIALSSNVPATPKRAGRLLKDFFQARRE